MEFEKEELRKSIKFYKKGISKSLEIPNTVRYNK